VTPDCRTLSPPTPAGDVPPGGDVAPRGAPPGRLALRRFAPPRRLALRRFAPRRLARRRLARRRLARRRLALRRFAPRRLARRRPAPPRGLALLPALALVALAPGWRDSPPAPIPLRVTVSAHGVATAVPIGGERVLTVAHVLEGARFVRVDGRPARVVRVDRRLDLAELAVPGVVAPALRTADTGDDAVLRVFRDGRPVALSAAVRRRVTASIAGHARPVLELAAIVEPGDSGAPVVDARGRVLGIVFARGSRGTWAVAVNWG
jgi:hypothetical protein